MRQNREHLMEDSKVLVICLPHLYLAQSLLLLQRDGAGRLKASLSKARAWIQEGWTSASGQGITGLRPVLAFSLFPKSRATSSSSTARVFWAWAGQLRDSSCLGRSGGRQLVVEQLCLHRGCDAMELGSSPQSEHPGLAQSL